MVTIYVIPDLRHSKGWAKLKVESCALRKRGLADGTWKNKISHLRAYIYFTIYFGATDFPVKEGVLLRFLAFLARGRHAARSATNIIGNIKWWAAFLDPPSAKVFESVQVSATTKGLSAQLSRPPRQKLPFSIEHLLMFYHVLDISDTKQLAAWCAMLVAFFGCFRASNLVPASKKQFDPLKQLTVSDISFEKDIVLIFYKFSKTNQNAKKVTWVPISSVLDTRFDVKKYLKLLVGSVKADREAPLFSYSKKNFHTKNSLVRILDKCIFETGLSMCDYSWHSFRRGAAVFAFELGLEDTAVQLLGDWSSLAFVNYLDYAFDRKFVIARKISLKFDSVAKHL